MSTALRLLSVLSAALWFALPPAEKPSVLQPFIFDRIVTKYSYNDDGTGSCTQEVRVEILSRAGVGPFGQLVFGYSSETERLAIDYVRVLKPDGQVLATPVETAPEASLEISKVAPVYSDYRERHVSVVGLSPGDTLEYKTTKTFVRPLALNQYWLSHSFNKQSQVRSEVL